MQPRSWHVQRALASIFLILGAWCVVAPAQVERVVLRPEFRHESPTSHLLFACFGAQAVLVGTVIIITVFPPRAFLVFGLIASIPFFIFFNWYYYFFARMFTRWMLLDVLGNLGILVAGIYGYALKKRELFQRAPFFEVGRGYGM